MAHGKWSEVEARGFLEALDRSGLSLQQFAKERGIVPQRLRWWTYKLRRAEAVVAPKEEAELPAVMPVRLKTTPRGEPVTVLLRTGHMLKVSHGFDEAAFARVVALLEGK
jgi:hypothetical protein